MTEPEETRANYAGIIIAICTLPIALFFAHIGKYEIGLNAAICVGVLVLAVGMCWDLRRFFWFWMVTALLLAIHIPLILMIQWPHIWVPKIALLPIGIVDLLIDVGVIRLAATFRRSG
jgi:hypothetical protein